MSSEKTVAEQSVPESDTPAEETPDAPAAEEATAAEQRPEIQSLEAAHSSGTTVEGKVIGWNDGGFHVVVGGVTAFCPRSEMETGKAKAPATYLDKSYAFQVLKVEQEGKRVVLSRAAQLRAERGEKKAATHDKVQAGAILEGRVASLTDFGAFVELGTGLQGLVHVSELAHRRVERPSDMLQKGQTVKVKVLKVEGRRISLSMRALEPDPWSEAISKYAVGSAVKGKVERTNQFGVFVELEPGLTGLLPMSKLAIPRGSSAGRMYPPGKKISVQVLQIEPRRRRISLGLEGSGAEGTRGDYQEFLNRQRETGSGFNALAAALEKLQG